jgi:hypothetical protein
MELTAVQVVVLALRQLALARLTLELWVLELPFRD